MGMLFGVPVSAGWADKAAARVAAQIGRAGFDEAMIAALAAEDVLAADETPVNVVDKTVPAPVPEDGKEDSDPEKEGKAAAGAPHMLITRTPDGRLTLLQAIGSRRKAAIAAGLPAGFTGYLITDGYTGYQHLLGSLAGIQQCAAHVIRRCRAVTKLGPGGLQSWAGDIITILREAHQAVEAARARGDTALDQQVLNDLLKRYDTAVAAGIIHNRLRDWDTGNHPGYAPGTWLRDYREQVFLFTRNFAVAWTNNVSERGAKAAKRHQAVSGYRHSLATLARWCRLRSYLDSAAAHGVTALDAIRDAITAGYRHSPHPADISSRTPVSGHVNCLSGKRGAAHLPGLPSCTGCGKSPCSAAVARSPSRGAHAAVSQWTGTATAWSWTWATRRFRGCLRTGQMASWTPLPSLTSTPITASTCTGCSACGSTGPLPSHDCRCTARQACSAGSPDWSRTWT
jgi:hypothetical protein